MSVQYEVARALERRHVRYLIVGEAALAHHARTRRVSSHRTVDYFVQPECRQRLAGVLGDLIAEGVFEHSPGAPLRWPETVRIINGLKGVSFNECYLCRDSQRDGDLSVPILGDYHVAQQFEGDAHALALLSQGERIRAMERVLRPSALVMRLQQKRRSIEEDRRAM
jgi:hypothetical protein